MDSEKLSLPPGDGAKSYYTCIGPNEDNEMICSLLGINSSKKRYFTELILDWEIIFGTEILCFQILTIWLAEA